MKRFKKPKKVFLLIILPILLSLLFLFPPTTTKLNVVIKNNQSFVEVPNFAKLQNSNGLLRSVQTIFSTPFDLKYYVITFKDNATYTWFPSGIGYILTLDGKKLDRFKASGKTETTVTLLTDNPLLLTSNVSLTTNELASRGHPQLVDFVVGFDVFAKPSYWDVGAKTILFVIAWNGVVILYFNIRDYIKR